MELCRDFDPRVPLTQHLESLTDLLAMVLLDPARDLIHQQISFVDLLVALWVGQAVSIDVLLRRAKRQGNGVPDAPSGFASGKFARLPNRARPHPAPWR